MVICDYEAFKKFINDEYPDSKEELSVHCEILNISIGIFKEDKEFFGMRLDFTLDDKYIELWLENINYINFYHSFTLSDVIKFDSNCFNITYDEEENSYIFELSEFEYDEPLSIHFGKYFFIEE